MSEQLRAALLAACLTCSAARAPPSPPALSQPLVWDAQIGALCPGSTVETKRPTLEQTGFDTVSVRVDGGGADAVWIVDAYGDVIDFSDRISGDTTSLHFDSSANHLVAHAHFSDCTHSVMNVSFSTWKELVDGYIASDQSGYSSGTWTAEWTETEVEQASLNLNVNYGTKVANFALDVKDHQNRPVPFMYIGAQSGTILGYKAGTVPLEEDDDGNTMNTLPNGEQTLLATLPSPPTYEANIYACAPLGAAIECVSQDMTSQMIASWDQTTITSESLTIPHAFASASRLVVHKPDATCRSSVPGRQVPYVLYQKGEDGSGITKASFSADESLSMVLDVASCNYQSAATTCTLTVQVVCGETSRHSGQIDLNQAYRAYLDSAGGTESGQADYQVPEGDCSIEHPVRGELWTNDKGQVCECFNGVAECGAAPDTTPYLTNLQAAGVTISGFVLFLVLVVVGYRIWSKSKEMRELPIEGKRRSIIASKHGDYVTGTSTHAGMETELPRPPSETVPAGPPPPPPPPLDDESV